MSDYSQKLKDPRWQRKRLEIFQRDNFKCVFCGDATRTLHVHHHEYGPKPWEIDNDKLNTTCERCHDRIHLCTDKMEEIVSDFCNSIPKDDVVFQMNRVANFSIRLAKHLRKLFPVAPDNGSKAPTAQIDSQKEPCDTNNTAKRTQVLQGRDNIRASGPTGQTTPENATGSTVSAPNPGSPVCA